MTRDLIELACDGSGSERRFELDVPSDLVAFAGHFEGGPVLPAAVLLDEVVARV